MQALFKIMVNGEDITLLIQDRLLDLSVEDKQGIESDSFTLKLDNREGKLKFPPTQVELAIYAGIETLNFLGKFTVDTLEESYPPNTLSISGSSADLTGSLKSHKQRHWDDTTLEMVLDEIASDNQLELAMHTNFSHFNIEHLDQTAESDLALLTRLASDYDALFKIADGRLLFTLARASQRLSGTLLSPVTIEPTQIISYRYSIAERNQVSQVKAKWRSEITNDETWEQAGIDGVTRILSKQYRTQADAMAASNETLKKLQTPQESLSLTLMPLPNQPAIKAETPLNISGQSAQIDGQWVVSNATHQLSGGGYQVSVTATRMR